MRNPALVEEMKTYKGRDEVPQDFDVFWDGEIDKVSVLPDYQLEEGDFHIPNGKFVKSISIWSFQALSLLLP